MRNYLIHKVFPIIITVLFSTSVSINAQDAHSLSSFEFGVTGYLTSLHVSNDTLWGFNRITRAVNYYDTKNRKWHTLEPVGDYSDVLEFENIAGPEILITTVQDIQPDSDPSKTLVVYNVEKDSYNYMGAAVNNHTPQELISLEDNRYLSFQGDGTFIYDFNTTETTEISSLKVFDVLEETDSTLLTVINLKNIVRFHLPSLSYTDTLFEGSEDVEIPEFTNVNDSIALFSQGVWTRPFFPYPPTLRETFRLNTQSGSYAEVATPFLRGYTSNSNKTLAWGDSVVYEYTDNDQLFTPVVQVLPGKILDVVLNDGIAFISTTDGMFEMDLDDLSVRGISHHYFRNSALFYEGSIYATTYDEYRTFFLYDDHYRSKVRNFIKLNVNIGIVDTLLSSGKSDPIISLHYGFNTFRSRVYYKSGDDPGDVVSSTLDDLAIKRDEPDDIVTSDMFFTPDSIAFSNTNDGTYYKRKVCDQEWTNVTDNTLFSAFENLYIYEGQYFANDFQFVSDDKGETWGQVSINVPAVEPYSISAGYGHIYIQKNDTIWAFDGKIFNDISTETIGQDIVEILHNDDYLIIVTENSVFYKRHDGLNQPATLLREDYARHNEIMSFQVTNNKLFLYPDVGGFLYIDLPLSSSIVQENNGQIPSAPMIKKIYPNPFNPSTQIQYTLPETGAVTISVFNVLGQQVRTLAEGTRSSGAHAITFNATGLPAGMYVVRLESTGQSGKVFAETKKVMLLK